VGGCSATDRDGSGAIDEGGSSATGGGSGATGALGGRATSAGEVLEFGHSGLLYNSNLVLYDRRPEARTESLWSQILGRAVAGPAAGTPLRTLPCELVAWSVWRERFPATTILARDQARADRYRRDPYVSYYGNDLLRYPVAPLPPGAVPSLKERCVILGVHGRRVVYPLAELSSRAAPGDSWTARQEGREVRFTIARGIAPSVLVEVDGAVPDARAGAGIELLHAFWFAWYAAHPEDPLAAVVESRAR
jgi:hypothetical protein